MKKNWAMRAAILMVALTLITSCFVSGTFAKYVTSGSGSDTARVAKFGVTITNDSEAFLTEYATDDTTTYSGTYSVETSVSDEKLVAPGTTHDVAAFSLTGTPEVAIQVTYAATLTLTGWTLADSSLYCPIVFTVDGETYGITGIVDYDGNALDHGYATIAALKAGVEGAFAEASAVYGPNTDLSDDSIVAQNSISWAWAFEGNSDVNDTYLGDQAAADNASTITIEITATVTQID